MPIDLREELRIIYNTDHEYDYVVGRHLLPDQKCSVCLSQPPMILDPKTKAEKPNPSFRTTADPKCPNCEGAGYDFEEYLYRAKYFFPHYRVEHEQDFNYGMSGANMITMYLLPVTASLILRPGDFLYLIESNAEGQITLPTRKLKKWKVVDAFPFHLDHNKMEFVKVYARLLVI